MMCMKNGEFKWTEMNQWEFERLKKKVTESPILSLVYFNKLFQVYRDTISLAIKVVLSQKGWRIEFFSENLDDPKQKYSFYDQ